MLISDKFVLLRGKQSSFATGINLLTTSYMIQE